MIVLGGMASVPTDAHDGQEGARHDCHHYEQARNGERADDDVPHGCLGGWRGRDDRYDERARLLSLHGFVSV